MILAQSSLNQGWSARERRRSAASIAVESAPRHEQRNAGLRSRSFSTRPILGNPMAACQRRSEVWCAVGFEPGGRECFSTHWTDRDDNRVEGLLGAHEEEVAGTFRYLLVTDQREVEVTTRKPGRREYTS
jgi:hypothetical protein